MNAIIAPVVFLGVVFILVVLLIIVYKSIVGESCACIRDPGGREKERQKKKNGYDRVSGGDDTESDEEIFVPPTLTVENVDASLEAGELVGPTTVSPYSAYSAFDETASLNQSYLTERGLGRLKFDIEYSREKSSLKVLIIEGDNLPSKEKGGAANFKIHLTLLPEKRQRLKSKSQSRYSPKFNETFTFKDVIESQLYTSAVRLRLYGVVGSGKLVGETFLQLADITKLENPAILGVWRAFRSIKTKGKK